MKIKYVKILTALLAAVLLMVLFPAPAVAWGNSNNLGPDLWNVKKPYNLWWGHCNSCRSCSGGVCGLNNTASLNNSSSDLNSTWDSAINKGDSTITNDQDSIANNNNNSQVSCPDGKCTPAYSTSVKVIDCTISNSSNAKVPVIDCTSSAPFYSTQWTLVYY